MLCVWMFLVTLLAAHEFDGFLLIETQSASEAAKATKERYNFNGHFLECGDLSPLCYHASFLPVSLNLEYQKKWVDFS